MRRDDGHRPAILEAYEVAQNGKDFGPGRELLQRRNSLRRERVHKELAFLQPLPARRLEDYSVELVKVTRNSTISVRRNLYSVPSQLIGERVEVRIFAEQLQVWFGGSAWPRWRGCVVKDNKQSNYWHVIPTLVRKPGAFAHYRYRQCLFPRLLFQVAYDQVCEQYPATAERQYVKLLALAAGSSEDKVELALRQLVDSGTVISYNASRHSVAQRKQWLRGRRGRHWY